jgi:hemerythrin-like domain-containing protein
VSDAASGWRAFAWETGMADRRHFLKTSAGAGVAGLALASAPLRAEEGGKPVAANEDLMREHGVLRRALLVYTVAWERLRSVGHADIRPAALLRSAQLFRNFGEDYHERKLEEDIIFPAVRKLKGAVATYPDILKQQHDRGRELTSYVMEVTRGGKLSSGNIYPLSDALRQFVLMYEMHAAREDTELFPAWKAALPARQYQEMGERFEHIEKQTFGHDGFEDALKQIAAIEVDFGMPTLAMTTIPAPPKPATG